MVEGLLVLEHGQHYQAHRVVPLAQLCRDIKAIHVGQIQVNDRQVRLGLPNQLQHRGALVGLAHQIKARIGLHDLPQALTEQRVVIDDYQSDALVITHWPILLPQGYDSKRATLFRGRGLCRIDVEVLGHR